MAGYTRARTNWLDWPNMSTPIQAVHLNKWDQGIADLKGLKFNAKDYGAVGDGVTDDTAAIQAAITAAGSQGSTGTGATGMAVVYIPFASVAVSGSGSSPIFDLSGLNKIAIVGSGMEQTVIKRTAGTGPVFYVLGTLASTDGYMLFRDFTVNGNSTGGKGFEWHYGCPLTRWENVEAINCTDGFYLQNSYENSFHNCWASANSGWGFNLDRQNDSTSLVSCFSSDNSTGGFRFADGWQGPAVGLWATNNPVNMLIEHSASAGTGVNPFMVAPQIIGGSMEGTDGVTTENLKVTSAVSTKIKGLRVIGTAFISAGSNALVSVDYCDGAVLSGIFTQGSGVSGTHVAFGSNAINSTVRDWTYVQAGSETPYSSAGTNNSQYEPGTELSYVEFTGNVTVSATSDAAANTVATAAAVTFDGSTTVDIEFECPEIQVGSGNRLLFVLFDGSSNLDRIADIQTNSIVPIRRTKRLTPSAGAHTYSIRAFIPSGTSATVNASTGGASTLSPGFIRIKAIK